MIFLIIGSLLSALSAFISLIDKWKKKSPKEDYKKNNIIAVIAFIFVLLGGCLSFFSGREAILEQEKSVSIAIEKEKENKILTKSLIESQLKLERLANNQLDSINNILKYSQRLNKAQFKITELQNELLNQSSGDGTKPYFNIFGSKEMEHYKIWFTIHNYSKYPISGLKIKVFDSYGNIKEVINQETGITYYPKEMNYLNEKLFEINILGANQLQQFYITTVPYQIKSFTYPVSVTWSQGQYRAHAILEGGKEEVTGKVNYYDSNGKLIKDVKKFFLSIKE